MEKFNHIYGHYPKCPVAEAGYDSYNNYLYCEEHGMEKFMKFTMFKKETTDKKYHNNPYRAVNFQRDESGNLICPNGRKFIFKYNKQIYKNNMEEQKKFTSVKAAMDVLDARNAVKNLLEIEAYA